MAAGQYNFTLEQGATLKKQFTYKDSAGAVVDLNGYDARMQIRGDIGSEKLAEFDNDALGGLSILPTTGSAASGTIELHIHHSSSSLYTFDQAVYDLEIQTGETVTRLLQGRIKLSKEVTRD
tara:strand:- start:16081 stop:16446 length:366 start_codon:yes stop_codon:yes gene_type:complete